VEVVEVEEVEVVEVEVVVAVVEDAVEVEVVDDEVEVVGVDVVDVEVDEVGAEVELVDVGELEVVDVEVAGGVGVDVVVVGIVLPPWTSPTLISSATKVPRMFALKRFSAAGFPSAQSWATTTVVFVPDDRPPTPGLKLHVVVASGTG